MILIYGKGKVGNGVASLCAHIGIPYEIRDDADPTTDFSLYSDIIPSPGIPAKHPVRAQKQCISELDFAYRYLPKGFTIMAVTGTDGKSTTCWILSEILRQEYGKENVFLSGNFDVPFSRTVRDILEKKIPSGFIVVEVSSFMSSALSQFRPDYSIFTNFVEDHLNWHPDLRDYFLSKWHLFEQTKRLCVTSPAVLEKAKEFGAPLELPLRMYGDQYPDKIDHNAIVLASWNIYHIEDTHFRGSHNAANILCVLLFCEELKISPSTLKKHLSNIRWLPHRIEEIGSIEGRIFIDDSKSTTPQSMEAAIRSFNKPVILIAGGSEKGATFDSLIPAFRSSLKHAVLIGTTREKIAASVREAGKHSEFAPDMTSAVRQAFARSEIGDVILLSPGCASFDMFRDYLDRADKFREAFRALQEQSHKVDLST